MTSCFVFCVLQEETWSWGGRGSLWTRWDVSGNEPCCLFSASSSPVCCSLTFTWMMDLCWYISSSLILSPSVKCCAQLCPNVSVSFRRLKRDVWDRHWCIPPTQRDTCTHSETFPISLGTSMWRIVTLQDFLYHAKVGTYMFTCVFVAWTCRTCRSPLAPPPQFLQASILVLVRGNVPS